MKVYRIAQNKYLNDLSGFGAEKFGGRWNSKGVPLLYTSSNLALSALEQLARNSLELLNLYYSFVELEFPDHLKIKKINISDLEKDWSNDMATLQTKEMGDQFISDKTIFALSVPSAMLPYERNILINPNHKAIDKIKISHQGPLNLNLRLS